jgi:hypothetical protein
MSDDFRDKTSALAAIYFMYLRQNLQMCRLKRSASQHKVVSIIARDHVVEPVQHASIYKVLSEDDTSHKVYQLYQSTHISVALVIGIPWSLAFRSSLQEN